MKIVNFFIALTHFTIKGQKMFCLIKIT